MSFIDQIFLRANISNICDFLLFGEDPGIDTRSCEERLKNSLKNMTDRLREECESTKKFEEIMDLLFEYVTEAEKVYMEIGLQAGIILATQIFGNLKPSFE